MANIVGIKYMRIGYAGVLSIEDNEGNILNTSAEEVIVSVITMRHNKNLREKYYGN